MALYPLCCCVNVLVVATATTTAALFRGGNSISINVDNYPSVQAALDFAADDDNRVAVVLFSPSKEYRLMVASGTHMLQLSNANGLRIDGQNASIIVGDPRKGLFSIRHCTDIVVQNIHIDYDPRPNVQGTVVTVDPASASITVELDAGDTLQHGCFSEADHRWALIKDPLNPRRQKPGMKNYMNVGAFRRVTGARQWNVSLPASMFAVDLPAEIKAGDAYVQLARTNNASVFSIYSSVGAHFADIRIWTAPAASYVALNCTGLGFRRVVTAPSPGRHQATGADGIFTVGTRSRVHGTPSIVIEDSVLQTVGDDGIILKTEPLACSAPPRRVTAGSSMLTLQGSSWLLQLRPGDELRLFDPRPSARSHDLGSATVIGAPDGIDQMSSRMVSVLVNTSRLLSGFVDVYQAVKIYNMATAAPFFVVRNNTIDATRRFGVLGEGHEGVIEDNVFIHTSSSGIMLVNGGTDGQKFHLDGGYVSRNVTIRRNRFQDCFLQSPTYSMDCKGGPAACASVIGSVIVGERASHWSPSILGWKTSPHHSQIMISENVISGWQPSIAGISVGGATDVVVRDNILRAGKSSPPSSGGDLQRMTWGAAVQLANVSRAQVTNNTVYGPFPRDVQGGAIKVGMDTRDVEIAASNTVVPTSSQATISNVEPRRDVSGAIVNAHDGQIVHENGTYYWFAAGYDSCQEFHGLNGCAGCAGVPIGPACGCGFEANTSVNLYTSPDLVTWTSHGNVLPLSTRPVATSLFSPRAIFNEKTGLWVLWYNYVPHYAVATSPSPFGPFVTANLEAGASFRWGNSSRNPKYAGMNAGIGDFSLFKDEDGVAYMLYSHDPAPLHPGSSNCSVGGANPRGCGKLSVAKLTPDFLASTWDPTTQTGEGHAISGFEAPAMFRRGKIYYALSSAACCYCGPGGKVYVHTAASPLGPYTLQAQTIDFGSGNITTQGQQTTVTAVADGQDFIWQGDRWQTAPDHLKSHDFQYWTKLEFGVHGEIKPMQWIDEFPLASTHLHSAAHRREMDSQMPDDRGSLKTDDDGGGGGGDDDDDHVAPTLSSSWLIAKGLS